MLDNGSKFKALSNVSLAVKPNQILGLLGPNGAGKTTLLSILTGIHGSDSGDAYIDGCNVETQISEVYKKIGVCPQFDLLWEDLTIEDHLLFYLRLKGVATNQECTQVLNAAEEVLLTPHLKKKVKELSGGMKRRLSLSIAIVGDPRVIFLDEPTTGLDPANRRQFWKILSGVKANRAIVLTTHIMKEADVLSDKIAIIDKGKIKAYGLKREIKKQYCRGFNLSGNIERSTSGEYQEETITQVLEDIKAHFNRLVDEKILTSFSLSKSFFYSFNFKVSTTLESLFHSLTLCRS